MVFFVKHERVKPFADQVIRMNSFSGDGWDDFIETTGIESGQRLAFTNLESYRLSVVVLGGDGLGLSKEDIRFQLPKKTPRPAFFRDRNGNTYFAIPTLEAVNAVLPNRSDNDTSNYSLLYVRFMYPDFRLEHLCSWGHHEDHVNEDHVIYTRFTGGDLVLFNNIIN